MKGPSRRYKLTSCQQTTFRNKLLAVQTCYRYGNFYYFPPFQYFIYSANVTREIALQISMQLTRLNNHATHWDHVSESIINLDLESSAEARICFMTLVSSGMQMMLQKYF